MLEKRTKALSSLTPVPQPTNFSTPAEAMRLPAVAVRIVRVEFIVQEASVPNL